MIRHLFKLVWHRKRANLLVMTEIFFSFLVLFAVSIAGLLFMKNYRLPLGFEWRNVLNVSVDMQVTTDDEWSDEMVNRYAALLRETRGIPGVLDTAGTMIPPYEFAAIERVREIRGRSVTMAGGEATDDYATVMGIVPVEGRWFQKSDDALGWEPAVINRELARDVFGSESAVGKVLFEANNNERETRVIGVVDAYREKGEYSTPANFLFKRARIGDPKSRPPRNIVIRVASGTGSTLEETIVKQLSAVAPGWRFTVSPMSRMRESYLRFWMTPLAIGGVVAGFLLLMVALGLIGVLWQSVTRRTQEIGLRRALGAAGDGVSRQILMETMVVTTFGAAVAVIVIAQIPLSGILSWIDGSVIVAATIVSAVLIYLITALAALYPSWLAARVQPATALHYE